MNTQRIFISFNKSLIIKINKNWNIQCSETLRPSKQSIILENIRIRWIYCGHSRFQGRIIYYSRSIKLTKSEYVCQDFPEICEVFRTLPSKCYTFTCRNLL